MFEKDLMEHSIIIRHVATKEKIYKMFLLLKKKNSLQIKFLNVLTLPLTLNNDRIFFN